MSKPAPDKEKTISTGSDLLRLKFNNSNNNNDRNNYINEMSNQEQGGNNPKNAANENISVVKTTSSSSTVSNTSPPPSSGTHKKNSMAEKGPIIKTKLNSPGKTIIRIGGRKRKTPASTTNANSSSSESMRNSNSNQMKKMKANKKNDNNINDDNHWDQNEAIRTKIIATGRWTEREHDLFKQGLELYGKEWKKVAELVSTRTVVQTRTHAQKYFQRLLKAANIDRKDGRKSSIKKGKNNDIPLMTPTNKGKSKGSGKSKKGGNVISKKNNDSKKVDLKRSPAATALLSRTSAGFEAIKKSKLTYNKKGAKNLAKPRVSRNSTDEEVMADSKYLELAKSGTASTSKKGKRNNNVKRKKKTASGSKEDSFESDDNVSSSSSSKKRPKPSLIGLRSPSEEEVFGKNGAGTNVPETPWAGHVALLKKNKMAKVGINNNYNKKKSGNGSIFLGNKHKSYRATQRSLRQMSAKRTMIHEGILTGDIRGLTTAIRTAKGEVAFSPRASPTATNLSSSTTTATTTSTTTTTTTTSSSSSSTTAATTTTATTNKDININNVHIKTEKASDISDNNINNNGSGGNNFMLERERQTFDNDQKLSQLSKLNSRPLKHPPVMFNVEKAEEEEKEKAVDDKTAVEQCVSNILDIVEDPENKNASITNTSASINTLQKNGGSNTSATENNVTKQGMAISSLSISSIPALEIRKSSALKKAILNINTSKPLSNIKSSMSVEFIRSRPQLNIVSVPGASDLSLADYINHPDEYGYTPLILVASLNEEFFKQIKKANKNDAHKQVPIEMVKILFLNKASVKYIDKAGYSCLHWAAAKGNMELCAEFLKRGCKINLQGDDGNTPLHLACCEGRVETVQYLLKRNADASLRNRWGRNAIELAAVEHRTDTMSHRKAAERLRTEIRAAFYQHDESWRTLLVHHPECQEHEPRKEDEWEHPERIDVIMKEIEEQNFFDSKSALEYSSDFNRANVKSLLRVHSTQYIKFIHDLSKQVKQDGAVIPFTPKVQKSIGGVSEGEVKEDDNCDTSFSMGTLAAARRAVGAVCYAVDRVLNGQNRNAFCAVRPPGHHAGISGLLKNATSCGFCIFNNIAVGALHALDEHNLKRVAILDFDVHHGNGTEEIINKFNDPSKLFFFSIHLYDRNKSYEFYPGTGKMDFLLRNIVNAPMKPLWRRDKSSSSSGRGKGKPRVSSITSGGRHKFRHTVMQKLLPALRAFNPELILLSSGFDGSENDVGNCNHSIGARSGCGLDLRPADYYWAASKIQDIADICCDGKVVSVLEGGYGQMVRYKLDRKNLATCVSAHIAALVDHKKTPLFPRKKTEGDSSSSSSDSDDGDRYDDESFPDPTYDLKSSGSGTSSGSGSKKKK